MGEYEPDDSRDVTLKPGREPGDIERTGPREGETRRGEKGEKGETAAPPIHDWDSERSGGTGGESAR